MEDTYQSLAQQICDAASAKSPGRLVVGIAGAPGSGKTTVADRVVVIINTQPSTSSAIQAQAVSLDGFHHTRRFLDALPNREEAHRRRGAPGTFDINAIVDFVNRVHRSAGMPAEQRPEILAPSFDHAVKDPVPNTVTIKPETSIVVLEGNYLLLDEAKWSEVTKCLDLRILVDVDPQVARERVAKRHLAAGIEPSIEQGRQRFDSNDAINGDLIRTRVVGWDVKIESVPEC